MSDAIERAAIALYVSMGQTHAIGTAEESWAKDRESVRAEFRRHAQAVLKAVGAERPGVTLVAVGEVTDHGGGGSSASGH